MLFSNQKKQLEEYLSRLIWKLFEKSIGHLSKKEEEEHYKEWKENPKISLITEIPLQVNPDSMDYYLQIGLAVSGDPRNYNKIMSSEKETFILDEDGWEDFFKLLNKLKKSDLNKQKLQ